MGDTQMELSVFDWALLLNFLLNWWLGSLVCVLLWMGLAMLKTGPAPEGSSVGMVIFASIGGIAWAVFSVFVL